MQDIKKEPIWVGWKLVQKGEGEKPTKIPIQKNGDFASSTNSKTWSTFDNVGENKGIVFEPSTGIIGIDFDHCVNERGDITNAQIVDFVHSAKTYVEYSPSGTGLHLLFKSTERIDLEANKHHFNDVESVEVYTWGRYFTFTGKEHPASKQLLEVNADIFLQLISQLGYPWKTTQKPAQIDAVSTTSLITKEEILKKMFASKNGEKMRRLYEGNITEYHNDASNADFNLCLSLAFWSNRDRRMMEEIWLQSPLGNREKTQDRQDYRDRTLDRAIEYTTDVYKPPTVRPAVAEEEDIEYEFIMMKVKEDFIPSLIGLNINRILRKNPQFIGKFRRNVFSHMVETSYDTDVWEPLTDGVILKTREYIAENFSFFSKLSTQMVQEAILTVAEDNRVNPPRDFFTNLVWDGVPRLNSWLHQTYGTPDDELHQQIGSNWLKGLVKRVMQPGCQFDHVLVLVSGQGMRKSTSIRVLGQPWHVETTHSTDNKDFYLLLAQNVIVEFSEGEILDRTSVKKLKAEITKTEDQIRPPYERGIIRMKRSCVFAVTTNELEFKDSTGNRRWLPVHLLKVADIDWLEENKEQLYAEAYHRAIVVNESTHIFSDELGRVQDEHLEWSDYDEKVFDWICDVKNFEEEGVALHDAIKAAYGNDSKITGLEEKRVSSTLRGLLKMENKNKRVGGNVRKRWFPTERTMQIINENKQDQNDF